MKKSAFGFICLLSILFSANTVKAQAIKLNLDPKLKEPSRDILSLEDRKTLLNTVELVLNEYAVAATLKDATKKRVTGESVKKYQDLFSPTAEVVKDYLKNVPDGTVSFKDYASAVFNLLGQEGVQVKVTSATVVEIVNDASGFFMPIVKIEKSIFNSLNANGEVEKSTSGRLMEQEMLFDVHKDNLNKAKISKIRRVCRGKECRPKAEYVKYAGFSLGVGYGIVSSKYSDTWEAQHARNSSLKAKSDIGLSIGYEWLSNKMAPRNSVEKNLFLSVGARAAFHFAKVELSDFSFQQFNGTSIKEQAFNNISDTYQRSGDHISVNENLKVGVLEVPLGVGFRIKSSPRSAWMMHLRVIPSLSLFGKASGSGSGDYIAAIDECNWSTAAVNAYNPADKDFEIFDAGAQTISGKPSLKKSGFGLALQFSPTLYMDRSDDDPTNALEMGLDFTFNLRSLIGHQKNTTDLFQYSNAYEQSVASQYLSGMSVFSIGLRVGLVKKASQH